MISDVYSNSGKVRLANYQEIMQIIMNRKSHVVVGNKHHPSVRLKNE